MTGQSERNRPGWTRLLAALLALGPAFCAPLAADAAASGVGEVADGPGSSGGATRFSPLSEINAENVAGLAPIYSYRTGHFGSENGAPTVVGNRLFLLTPFPHALIAFDFSRPERPRVAWRYAPPADRRAEGLTCCGRVDHGPVVAGDRVYFTTLDGGVYALDAESGRLLWQTRIADPSQGETLASPPLPAQGRLLVGNAGGDYGARGWLAALDAATGDILWKRYSTGPDSEVGIDATFAPHYARDRGRDLGIASWPPGGWQNGGGTLAGALRYDPETRFVFQATGRPAPWNPDQRAGDNKWTAGLFARDAASGMARWFVGLNPHDPFALGAGGSTLLLDSPWQGAPRRLLIHAAANGFLYVIDRASGEILAADRLTGNAVAGVDAGKGAPRYAGDKKPRTNAETRDVCPTWMGATGDVGAAFSPVAGLLYVPINRLCMDIEYRDASYIRGTPYIGANVRMVGAATAPAGGLVAWDIGARKAAWRIDERFPIAGDVLATAGGLLFYGTLDGRLRARDARTGKELWRFETPAGIASRPVTFRGADGRQYLAIAAGAGRVAGMAMQRGLDPRDATAALGLASVLGRLPPARDPEGTLYLFRLP